MCKCRHCKGLENSKSSGNLNSKHVVSNTSPSFIQKAKFSQYNGASVLKGSAKNHSLSSIFSETIEVAKKHRISLNADIRNAAIGNCLFESVIDNINHRPTCFSEKLDEGVDNYRVLWVSELEEQYKLTPSYQLQDIILIVYHLDLYSLSFTCLKIRPFPN